jgi:hypothetical protein
LRPPSCDKRYIRFLDAAQPRGYIGGAMTQIATISIRRRRLFQAVSAFDRI